MSWPSPPETEAAPESEGEPAEDELSRAVEDTEAAEAIELPAPPQRNESDPEDSAKDVPDPETSEPETAEDQLPAEVPEDELPVPADEEGPARPEEEVADAAEVEAKDLPEPAGHGEAAETTEPADDTEPDVALSPEEVAALTAEQDADASQDEPADGDEPEAEPDESVAEGDADEDADLEAEVEPEVPEFLDEQDAPIPASRRAKRLLRDTESLPRLAPELMDELNETTGQIAKHDDPDRVDPELLKKQQALAAKAMQANQARMRQQQEDSDREAQRRGQQRPDSEVITGKTVRDSRDGDHQEEVFLTGHIEPVDAQGAHGLELNEMIDESSKQAGRQNMMMWLLIVLAVLLVVAIGVVIFTVFL